MEGLFFHYLSDSKTKTLVICLFDCFGGREPFFYTFIIIFYKTTKLLILAKEGAWFAINFALKSELTKSYSDSFF